MAMVTLDPAANTARENYFLLTGLCIPRPIAWVSTVSAEGVRNLAPHSYFNIVSSDPPVVHFTSTGRKDSLTNAEATGEFVVNIVSADLVEVMNLTAADFPHDEDEFSWARLEAAPSSVVAPPRVAAARAAMECRVRQILAVGNGNMVFGDVLAFHIDASVWAGGRVDPDLLAPVARLSGNSYAGLTPSFKLPRPTWGELRAGAGAGAEGDSA